MGILGNMKAGFLKALEKAAAITIKVCVKGLPDNHQFALDEFKESFYNPNKQMLESNFAVSTSIVHDRSFILYKNMRGESCKHIG